MKSKDKSKIEYYKGIIRQLESENSKLKKELSKYDNNEEYEVDDSEAPSCPECSEGQLTEVQILNRIITRCKMCDYRKARKA